ncbi:hypothetical protein KFE80_13135 [bacterium SCSIO 12696]|nr:hypothetical protein KFE80_13135 [bacterium SCSIO 12696]
MQFKTVLLLLAMIFAVGSAWGQVDDDNHEVAPPGMTQKQLNDLIEHYGDDVKLVGNAGEFRFNDVEMLVVSDANADRMRIISPIAHISNVEPQMVVQAMAANFHSVLDARYAIGDDGTIYAAFIHPLSPLTEQQLASALRQVASAHETFGSSFSSGELVFPGPGGQQQPAPPPDSI